MDNEAPVELNAESLNSDRRFALLVHSIKDYAVFLLDANGYVTSWNQGAENIKGYTADEIFGQHFSRFYTEDDRAAGRPQHALRAAAENGNFETEGWRVRKDGSLFWAHVVIDPVLDHQGKLIGFAKVVRDMSEKRRVQQALYESEQRFRLLVQGVHDYAIYMLDPAGYVTNWNSGAALIKGYTEEEIVGRHFSCFYTPEDQASGEPQRGLEAALKHNTFQTETWRVRKDGSRFWASVVIDPIYDEEGKLLGFAKVTRDVTERKLAQEKIDRQREALSQSQKLEALGRLTGSVAHDFNNLLAIIRTAAELLQTSKTLTPEKQSRYVGMIADTATRAARLTDQLLTFARRQPMRPKVFRPGSRIEGLQQIIETTLGSRIALEVKFPADLAAVEADANQFETAILNMVINARDATPDGGAISISGHNATLDWLCNDATVRKRDFVAIVISDTGSGIEPSVLQNIFEPFFTTKGVHKGTGLGLSQVYGFAKQSGGDVVVDSTPGKGSNFTLYLPCVATDKQASDWDGILSPAAQRSFQQE